MVCGAFSQNHVVFYVYTTQPTFYYHVFMIKLKFINRKRKIYTFIISWFLYIVLINTCMVPFLSIGDYSFNSLSYTAQDLRTDIEHQLQIFYLKVTLSRKVKSNKERLRAPTVYLVRSTKSAGDKVETDLQVCMHLPLIFSTDNVKETKHFYKLCHTSFLQGLFL